MRDSGGVHGCGCDPSASRRSVWVVAALVLALAAPAVFVVPPQPVAVAMPARLPLRWHVAGGSVRGRRILVARFGSGSRRVLFVGGVHGDEWGTDAARSLAAWLHANPSAIPAGWRADVVVCLNPDGTVDARRGNAHGVDLNRNFPSSDWRPGTEGGLTHGSHAGSEPETQVLLRVLRTGYARVISLHSKGPLMDPDGPGAVRLASRMGAKAGYPVGDIAYDASIRGSLGRYVVERYRVPVVTVEMGTPGLGAGLRAALLEALR